MRCGTRSAPRWPRPGWISRSSRSCSGTPTWTPRSATSTSRRCGCGPPTTRPGRSSVPGPDRRAARAPGAADLVADYERWLAAEGRGSACYVNAAWAFLGHWPDPAAFAAEPLARQLALVASQRPFVTFLMLTGRLRPGYDYLAHRKIGGLLVQARRGVFAGDIARFATAATDLDYGGHIVKRASERVVLRVLIQTGRPLDEVVVADVDELAAAFRRCAEAKGNRSSWVNDRSLVYAAHRVLFHLGVLDTPPEDPRRRPGLAGHYGGVDEPLRSLFLDYCDQAAATRAPATVKAIASHLAGFGRFLASLAAAHHPDDTAMSVGHQRGQILTVRQFLTDILQWGWPAAPTRTLIFPRDIPQLPQPLPRYLPPDADRRLTDTLGDLSARGPTPLTRLHADALLFTRATGLRIGELRELELDCVHEIDGHGAWLKVPLGKLATERMVPLDTETVDILDRIADRRTPGRPLPHPRTGRPVEFLLVHQGRRISAQALRAELTRAATEAGLKSVTPHQLRHTYATALVNAGVSLQALMQLLGHYAGDLVKWRLSGGGPIESGEQSVEHFLAAELSFLGGVVALCLQGRAEFDGGLEESAGFADGFEVAVQADGSGAVAVAEHAAVHLDTELAHFGAFGVGGQCAWLVVEGFDLFADGEVFVGDGAVGDSGVHEGHPHRSVPQQRGQGFEGHAAVDRLGRQGMPEAVGRNMADASRFRGFGDCPIDAAFADALAVLDEQVAAAQAGGSGGDPGVEEILELGMQGDVAVGAQFAERHVQPVRGADLHDGIDCEVEEFALAQAGAGQELHTQSDERVVVSARGLQELGERGVVEEAGQRVVPQRQVAGEHEHAGGDVVAVPFGEPLEAGAQGAKVFGETDLGQPAAAGRGPGGQVQLVGLDVCPTQVGDAEHLGGVDGEPAGELPQHALDAHHCRGPQRQPGLGDVPGEGGGQPWRDRRPLGGPLGRAVWGCFAGSGVEDAEVEQSGLRTEQRRAERLGAMAVGSVASYRGGQRFSLCVDHRLGQPLGSQPGQCCHLGQGGPLQAGHDGIKPELGGGRGEPFVEPAVMMGGDFAEVGPARHEIVGAGPQPSRHDQPTDHPSVLQRQCALRCQRQRRPAGHPNAGEKRARHRGHRVSGEHPGRDEVGPIRLDELLDVVAMCW